MSTKTKHDQEEKLKQLQFEALDKIREMIDLIDTDKKISTNFVPIIALTLTGLVSTAADLAEMRYEGASTYLFKEVEAGIKQGDIANIRQKQKEIGGATYSISDIKPDDYENGMNYLGQALSTTLINTVHELPESMRNPEMLLRGVEALLANLLNSKFRDLGDVHNILDSLCEHVHMNLKALDNKVVPIK